ncbi:TraK family protein [Desulforhopalus singaporensis]|uniref:Uncharacterized protein n=1 Tax=Desulforhopalus singaporensis TaxID=91360 RepID=A0A1H0PB13_9BACT|nr:TraK family protein [Desulforhopalus singaporensis]SDP02282.1 hypothetical protein SAMN05660330_01595 [Desulforhopalus singaporensis]
MEIKPSCKSQFLAIKEEAIELLEKGYSKKAVYRYFRDKKKIAMSYTSWRIIVDTHKKSSPFAAFHKANRQKQNSTTAQTPTKTSTASRSFKHDPTPLPVDFNFNQKKKEGK